jgi:tRNA(Ile)-lysidine synthase
MLNAFRNYVTHKKLFSKEDQILLALSGGIDSVVLCELFSQARLNFGIAHCNFQLRGNESDGDEHFAEELAASYNVSFHSITFDTETYAHTNKLSIQEAARDLRYEWFEQVRKEFGYSLIATAHHGDDSIETFFINLVRGTGISGLHGILPKQKTIIRPLLFTDKKAILAFAKKNKLSFRNDSSNASEKYLRNRIRKYIIPAFQKLNPSVNEILLRDMEHLHEVEQILKLEFERKKKDIVRTKKSTVYISVSKLKKLEHPGPYLYEYLRSFNFQGHVISEIIHSLNTIPGKQFFSSSHRLIRDRKDLIIQKKEDPDSSADLFFVKKNQRVLQTGNLKLKFSWLPSGTKISRSVKSASLDFDTLSFPLCIRKWKKGDSFQPIGMKGRKKLSDFFIDQKLSIAEKENTWLLTSANEVVWVIGLRIDDRFKITAKTKKIYFAELTE